MVGEMAIALVLLTAGGLMVKSVARLQATELGFVPASVLTVRLVLPAPQYDRARGSQFIVDLIERLASRPDTGSVAFGSCAPLSGGCNRTRRSSRAVRPRRTGASGRSACSGPRPATSTRWASGCAAAASSPDTIAPVSRRSSSSTRPPRAPTGLARIRSESASRSGREASRTAPRWSGWSPTCGTGRSKPRSPPTSICRCCSRRGRSAIIFVRSRRSRRRRSCRRSAPRSKRSIPICR